MIRHLAVRYRGIERVEIREAVIVDTLRTPTGKRGGALAGWHPTDLLAHALSALVERTGIDPEQVDDVVGGCVTQVGEQGCNVTRNAWVVAGLPWTVPATTVDRQCGSSQQAVQIATQAIMSGTQDLVIACGVESMSRAPLATNASGGVGPFSEQFLVATDGLLKTQFEVSQHMAENWKITREEMDGFAVESHRRAAAATERGEFEREILPVECRVVDEDSEVVRTGELLTRDEGIRPESTPERLAALEPVNPFQAPDITAGNSSQMSDGAAAMLLADRATAERLGLPMRGAIRHVSVAAEDAVWVLTAPNRATRRMLERSGMSTGDFDAVEVNEAFAAVTIAWQREFAVQPELLNPRGGAIALGHPLGASGVRLMTTMLHYLEDTGGRFGFQTMCEGGGQANATVIERLG